MTTPISIVVPALNAARTIEQCLASIVANVSPECEIIVVDNGSTDATVSLARGFAGVAVDVVPSGFVSLVRNVGARRARHAILAFVDSDCTVSPGWQAAIADVLSREDVGVTGSRHVLPDRPTWCERAWAAAHRRDDRASSEVAYIPAGNLAVRASVFASVGGFDETLQTGEDPDLCARIAQRGYRILQDVRIRCVHLGEPKTLAQVFRRERWHGRGARFHYADGRIAPITWMTALFAALLAGGAATAVSAAGAAAVLAGLAAPWLIPAAYTARHVRKLEGPLQALQLWLVYAAYFLGRTAAFPVVLVRAWGSARPRTPSIRNA
jgi:GT2 family glycosyltransferase